MKSIQEEIKKEFEEKFCATDNYIKDNGRSVKDWKGYWEEVDVYAEDVFNWFSSKLKEVEEETRKKVNESFRAGYSKAEDDCARDNAGIDI